MKGFPDLPPLWWVGSVGLIYFVEFLFPVWHFTSPLLLIISWFVFGAALILIGWSALWFFQKKTPIEPHHQPKHLIVEGPYRISRNPIYLALVLLTIGSAIGHGSVVGLVLAGLLWWVLDRRFAVPEEEGLCRAFGNEAEQYLKETRRWL